MNGDNRLAVAVSSELESNADFEMKRTYLVIQVGLDSPNVGALEVSLERGSPLVAPYLPTRCPTSLSFSKQTNSSRSVSAAKAWSTWIDQGLV